MKKLLAIAALALLTMPTGIAQEVQTAPQDGAVTISSKGGDVRNVLFDLFSQSKKSFVLEPNVRFALYLALTGVQFDEALEIVCHTASLKFEINNGIYFVTKTEPSPAHSNEEKQPSEPIAKPKGRLTDAELQRKVTTRFAKADIRNVFAEFSKQTDIEIIVDKKVPAYKVDAFLINTSLKYALDVMTKAAGLVVVRTDDKSLIVRTKA